MLISEIDCSLGSKIFDRINKKIIPMSEIANVSFSNENFMIF